MRVQGNNLRSLRPPTGCASLLDKRFRMSPVVIDDAGNTVTGAGDIDVNSDSDQQSR